MLRMKVRTRQPLNQTCHASINPPWLLKGSGGVDALSVSPGQLYCCIKQFLRTLSKPAPRRATVLEPGKSCVGGGDGPGLWPCTDRKL
jgi:hypothetical protein